MNKQKSKQSKFTIVLFAVYLLLLTWIIVFKMQFSFKDFYYSRSINLIPFAESVIVNGKIDFSEIINNLLIFVPFGLYISMLKPDRSLLKKVAPIIGASLLFEVLQFIFAIGASDITDLIANTLGGIIGIGVYFIFRKLFKVKANKIVNILAFIGTVLIIVLIFLLYFLN